VIVYENGKSGFLGEHSCMDGAPRCSRRYVGASLDAQSSGTPTLRMNEFMLASLAAGKVELGPARVARTGTNLPEPTALPFELDAASKENVSAAEKRFDALVAQHDMQVRSR
jgi:carnitine O-acetyltransferase